MTETSCKIRSFEMTEKTFICFKDYSFNRELKFVFPWSVG